MRTKVFVSLAVAAAVVTVAACAASAAATAPKTSPAETAIQAAMKQNLYVFLTFYKKNDAASASMLEEVKKLQAKYSDRASFVSADIGGTAERPLAWQYSATASTTPLTLVIAPNGAVTARFYITINPTALPDAFVSKGMADLLKVLQDGKLAAVCIQSAKTKMNNEVVAAAEGLREGAQFRGALDIVKIDLSDSSEAKVVQKCKVDPNSENAQLVILAAPDRILGTFDGTATCESIGTTLIAALRGGTCGGGGGCCSKK
jgi:hypothetical protein